jgi:hypothetical protein
MTRSKIVNAMVRSRRQQIPEPVYRRLRTFAVDPGLTAQFATTVVNEMTLAISWERLKPGPAGEYIKILDIDEHGKRVHPPVRLDEPAMLATDGLPASDGNPQFRQQMVYAVAMRTIRNFERALGRPAHWPPRVHPNDTTIAYQAQLRMCPHYYTEANAHYLPEKGLFGFGYFRSLPESPFPGTTVFTCLSQDVIAHELSHALLLGMNVERPIGTGLEVGRDTLAFHEAFCDLIALLQHFGRSDVLLAQLAEIRGSLDEPSGLGAVALQFGQALGRPDGIRNALGQTVDGRWQPRKPDPKLYQTIEEPHDRGDVLVAAVFDAFKKIYESRVADLRRIATRGTGVLPGGSLHPDLVNRFADEASRAAQRVLEMCLRAVDYLPPVEITFGDYLRAIVTADYDVDPIDRRRYRVAFLQAFRTWGVFPSEVGTLSLDTLLWPAPRSTEVAVVSAFVRSLKDSVPVWNMPREREPLWNILQTLRAELQHELRIHADKKKTSRLGPVVLAEPFEVKTFDLSWSVRSGGDVTAQWVIKIAQGSSGCTLIVDVETGIVRRFIVSRGNRRPGGTPVTDEVPPSAPTATVAPATRRLRVFAFDPTLGVQLDTVRINEVALTVPWERDATGGDALVIGPAGEYVEVIDRDPASGCFYAPIDLNDPKLLAQDGLPPSESNPQFHQQMVYAVSMRTIQTFECALGRPALWSPRREVTKKRGKKVYREEYVRRLRIYPHALREANAYYSPDKKALLFGYFPAAAAEGPTTARLTVFTCLSHDIVAHEITHALLDGMHRRFNEPSNADVLAFHEAFADIVALFQHFSIPQVLRHQIAATRGDLSSQNRLGELAQQFGQAVGRRGALRSAIGQVDESGQWSPREPDPDALSRLTEPHDRGAILVAAVFDAFLTIYKARVADLLRIATEGTGVLPAGHLHPDLVNRMADEAADASQSVLDMCIRALDYCPPVDLTFGDYLRAIMTADFEFNPVDERHHRVAFVEAFRRYGIVPEGVRTLSVDGLLWRPTSAAPDEDEEVVLEFVKDWAKDIGSWKLSKDREALYDLMRNRRIALHDYLAGRFAKGVRISGIDPKRPFEVHSIRPSMRSDWEGRPRFQWIVELTQRLPQFVDPADAKKPGVEPDYYFRGGCTLILEADTGKVRYAIRKRLDEERRARQLAYLTDTGNQNLAATYFGGVASEDNEPFAMLHRL